MKKIAFFSLLIILSIFLLNLYFSFKEIKLNWNRKKIAEYKTPKLFCLILTHDSNESYAKQTEIYKSWARKCDNYKFLMTIPTELANKLPNVNADEGVEFDFNNFSFLQPPGYVIDKYDNLAEKIFMSFKYLYNYYNDYDWYLKTDDDTFIFVDNLRQFVSDKNASFPVTYGHDFKPYIEKGYHSGGAGYLLSKEAFKRFGKELNDKVIVYSKIDPEDTEVARVLRILQIYPDVSLDNEGRERFHSLDISMSYYGNWPDWYEKYVSNPIKLGYNCCSESSISFHSVMPDDIQKITRIVEKYKTSNITKIIKEFLEI